MVPIICMGLLFSCHGLGWTGLEWNHWTGSILLQRSYFDFLGWKLFLMNSFVARLLIPIELEVNALTVKILRIHHIHHFTYGKYSLLRVLFPKFCVIVLSEYEQVSKAIDKAWLYHLRYNSCGNNFSFDVLIKGSLEPLSKWTWL